MADTDQKMATIRNDRTFPLLQPVFRLRGFIAGVVLAPALVWVAFSHPLLRGGGWADCLARSVGWLLFLAGAAFRFWSTLYVGGRKRGTLVVQGPYSISRNPLYFGAFLMVLSSGLFLESALWMAFVAIIVLAYVYGIVPTEESDLRLIHGQNYETYCRRVPRFWPDVRLFQSPQEFNVRLKGLIIESKRAAVWIFMPLGCELLTCVRRQPWWPQWSF